MKFTTIAAAATTLFGLSLAQVKYEYVHVTHVVTVDANGESTPTQTTEEEQPSVSTWVFSTNVLGQDIAFTSVVSNVDEANATLYRQNLVIQSGDSLTTEKLAVIVNPSTLVTSTLSSDEASDAESEEAAAIVSFTPTSETSQPTQQSVEATSIVSSAHQLMLNKLPRSHQPLHLHQHNHQQQLHPVQVVISEMFKMKHFPKKFLMLTIPNVLNTASLHCHGTNLLMNMLKTMLTNILVQET